MVLGNLSSYLLLFNVGIKLLSLLNYHPNTVAVAGKFGGVHTLHGGNAIREVAFLRGSQWILEHISAFGQPTHKKVGGGIFGAFVIAQTILLFVLRYNGYRFETCCTHIF